MPFATEPAYDRSFRREQEVYDWINETQSCLRRIPLCDLLNRGATFQEDAYLQNGGPELRFNTHAFKALCSKVGIRSDILNRLGSHSLASDVLNDLLIREAEIALSELAYADEGAPKPDFLNRSYQARNTVNTGHMRAKWPGIINAQLIVDQSDTRYGTVVGVVSDRYSEYSNASFLDDIQQLLEQLRHSPLGDNLRFHDGYGVNTEMTLRYMSSVKHGTIRGPGGSGEDMSELGLEFRNSMVGTKAVRIDHFLHRLVCANGMIVKVGRGANSFSHLGDPKKFPDRLSRCFKVAYRNIDRLQRMLEKLGNLTFRPDRLARNMWASRWIFELVPGGRRDIARQNNLFPFPKRSDPLKEQRDHQSSLIGLIPEFMDTLGPRSNQAAQVFTSTYRTTGTMFDFVNIFTEYAKRQKPYDRLKIEKKAGRLAKYIADHANNFV